MAAVRMSGSWWAAGPSADLALPREKGFPIVWDLVEEGGGMVADRTPCLIDSFE
jgi:hypothetical protein